MGMTKQKTGLRETRNVWRLRREDALRARLRQSPPDLWYDIVRRADPDLHSDLIFWMINQKQCDFAVAVHVLLTGPIRFHIEADTPLPSNPDENSIWAAVLMNWYKGLYRAHEIACDRSELDEHAMALRQTLRARKGQPLSFPIPEALLNLAGGRPVALDPRDNPDLAPDLWKMCRDLEISVESTPPGLARYLALGGRKLSETFHWARDWAHSLRFLRHRQLFERQEDYVDWVSDYYVNRARHTETLRRRQTALDPNPALRFGAAAALSAAMGFTVLGGAAIGIVDLLSRL